LLGDRLRQSRPLQSPLMMRRATVRRGDVTPSKPPRPVPSWSAVATCESASDNRRSEMPTQQADVGKRETDRDGAVRAGARCGWPGVVLAPAGARALREASRAAARTTSFGRAVRCFTGQSRTWGTRLGPRSWSVQGCGALLRAIRGRRACSTGHVERLRRRRGRSRFDADHHDERCAGV
jgi:hypothetical protein